MRSRVKKRLRFSLIVLVAASAVLAASSCSEPLEPLYGDWVSKEGQIVSFHKNGEMAVADGWLFEAHYVAEREYIGMTLGILGFQPREVVRFQVTEDELTLTNDAGHTVVLTRAEEPVPELPTYAIE